MVWGSRALHRALLKVDRQHGQEDHEAGRVDDVGRIGRDRTDA